MFKKWSKSLYILLVLLFLYFPLFLLVFSSFNNAKYSSQWQHFSFKWFMALWHDQILLHALFNSLILAFCAALIATFNSVVAAVLFVFNRSYSVLKRFLIIPSFLIILPDLILGVGFLFIFNLLNIPFGFTTLWIAHTTFCMPFVIFSLVPKIKAFNLNYYYAGLDLGASKLFCWKKIIFPLLAPAIVNAFFLAFTLSFDDIIISYFVAGPEFNILPLTIFGMIRSGATPELNALCTLTLILSFGLIMLTQSKLRKA